LQKELKNRKLLLDTCVFLHYLLGDELADHAEHLIRLAVRGDISLAVSSEAYDDAITAFRSKGVKEKTLMDVLEKWASIPHETLSVTMEIAIEALKLYRQHGGPRKLHYFDAFHVATAKYYNLPLVTSDEYIIENARQLGVKIIDLKRWNYPETEHKEQHLSKI